MIKSYQTLKIINLFFLSGILLLSACKNTTDKNISTVPKDTSETAETVTSGSSKTINIALLLDTSNSMDGLIEQAKSQLWKIINQLTKANKEGEEAAIKIALYEYGNDHLVVTDGFVRQIAPLTNDLDEISERLFELKTNGGSEYCGYVIQSAINQLEWGQKQDGLNAIFIAGNETFTQGPINFEKACANAKEKNIIINTIYCGDYLDGKTTGWEDGARITGGEYLNIDMDQTTTYIASPFDVQISSLNDSLNSTYIGYGKHWVTFSDKQKRQDLNATSYSMENNVARTISKTSKMYKNTNWDLIDKMEEDSTILNTLSKDELPEIMQKMSLEEQQAFLLGNLRKRNIFKKQIQELGKKREAFITKQQKTTNKENSLENSMLEAIKKSANEKGFKFKDQ
ncbi:MAG: VWA domain-containing protein [Flavobacteriales bacterium]|jgi:hypothetical protein|nr:VWA domain-containing protein [Flavobacteriales bacterium]